MRVIIAGSRTIDNPEIVRQAIAESGFEITTVVCGMANGVDLLGWEWANERGIPKDEHPANWRPSGKFDRSAGHKRNAEMAEVADALIAVWNGKSRGTGSMVEIAKRKGLKVYVKYTKHKYEQDTKCGIGFCTVCFSDEENDGNHIV